jgi:hypothetical protein
MSARNYVETFGAGESKNLPAGRYFFIRSATSAVDIETQGNPGSPARFIGVGAGARFGPVAEGQGWKLLRVTSAGAQIVEIIISDDGDFEVANAVTVTGAVSIAESPSSALASPAAVARGTGGADTIAANLSRRRITVSSLSTNTGSVFIQAVGAGAGRGIELQPGQVIELKTTAAFDIRNDSGASQTYSTFEET